MGDYWQKHLVEKHSKTLRSQLIGQDTHHWKRSLKSTRLRLNGKATLGKRAIKLDRKRLDQKLAKGNKAIPATSPPPPKSHWLGRVFKAGFKKTSHAIGSGFYQAATGGSSDDSERIDPSIQSLANGTKRTTKAARKMNVRSVGYMVEKRWNKVMGDVRFIKC